MVVVNRSAVLRSLLAEIEADQARHEVEYAELVKLRAENLWLREALWNYVRRSSWMLQRNGHHDARTPVYEWSGGDEPWAAAEAALGV